MHLPYSERTMQSDEVRYRAPSGRFFLLLAVIGGLVGLALLLLDAPFWLFYVAPILMVPLVVWGLRSLDGVPPSGKKSLGSAPEKHMPPPIGRRPSPVLIVARSSRLGHWLVRQALGGGLLRRGLALVAVTLCASALTAALFGLSTYASVSSPGLAIFVGLFVVLVAVQVFRDLVLPSEAYRIRRRTGGHFWESRGPLAEPDQLEIKLERARRWRRGNKAKRLDRELKGGVSRVFVAPADDGWLIHIESVEAQSIGTFNCKREALIAARQYLLDHGSGSLVTLDERGRVRDHAFLLPSLGGPPQSEKWKDVLFAGGEDLRRPGAAAGHGEPDHPKRHWWSLRGRKSR